MHVCNASGARRASGLKGEVSHTQNGMCFLLVTPGLFPSKGQGHGEGRCSAQERPGLVLSYPRPHCVLSLAACLGKQTAFPQSQSTLTSKERKRL